MGIRKLEWLAFALVLAIPVAAQAQDPEEGLGEALAFRAPGSKRAEFQFAFTLGAAVGQETPGFTATGAGGIEWGVRWKVNSALRMGIRNTWTLTVLPWSLKEDTGVLSEEPMVGQRKDGAVARRGVSVQSGLLWTSEIRLGGPVLLDLSVGPAFLASGMQGAQGLLCWPMFGTALEIDLHQAQTFGLRLRLGADVLLHGGDNRVQAVWAPQAGMAFVF